MSTAAASGMTLLALFGGLLIGSGFGKTGYTRTHAAMIVVALIGITMLGIFG